MARSVSSHCNSFVCGIPRIATQFDEIDGGLELRLAFAKPLLGMLFLVDVLQDGDRAGDLAGIVAERCGADADPGLFATSPSWMKSIPGVTTSPRSALAPGYCDRGSSPPFASKPRQRCADFGSRDGMMSPHSSANGPPRKSNFPVTVEQPDGSRSLLQDCRQQPLAVAQPLFREPGGDHIGGLPGIEVRQPQIAGRRPVWLAEER